ncbi:MAG: hypothetical protein ABL955_02760 [Elusimicrobiota bacterium]
MRRAFSLTAAALLAALLAFPAAAADLQSGTDLENPSTRDSAILWRELINENKLATAERFLADTQAQEAVKARDSGVYLPVFARATELVDLKGVLDEQSSVHSIRQSLSVRMGCAFCLDGVAFPAWARKNITGIGEPKLASLNLVLWNWDKLTKTQRNWVVAQKKDKAWPKMRFPERHEVMRAWALYERDALMKLNPADKDAVDAFNARAYELYQILSSHEMSGIDKLRDQITAASQSLAEARVRVAMNNDPRQKALLAEAINAPTPEARLSALAAIFENYGERPAALLAAAPPRADQKFDDESRRLVGAMLKTAMLKETEGTFAGEDLKAFYAKTPLTVEFTMTDMAALGWFRQGADVLHFNERYVEEYVKRHGKSVEELKRDPVLLQNLARIFASTFVHEAQHHRQDVWARENKMPRLYHQGDEVEAFQADSLFMMQKMRTDKKFAAWAAEEAKTSDLVAGDLSYAKHMETQGPEYFARKIPNAHYPETLSKEGTAWCHILWHNSVTAPIERELRRRDALPPAARSALEASAPALEEDYKSPEAFRAALTKSSRVTLVKYIAEQKEAAANAAKYYNQLRARQESVAATTMERYNTLEPRDGPRTERGAHDVPSPIMADQENP